MMTCIAQQVLHALDCGLREGERFGSMSGALKQASDCQDACATLLPAVYQGMMQIFRQCLYAAHASLFANSGVSHTFTVQ